MLKANIYNKILLKFPQQFAYCFAYGSGVKKQIGNYDLSEKEVPIPADPNSKFTKMNKNMIDLLFCVNDSENWHALNLEKNPTHYSGLKIFGNKTVTWIQQNSGAKCYCNTLIPIENGNTIKYNVISKSDLLNDLLNWCDLYVAGRLHKPVDVIHSPDKDISNAIEQNLRNAVHTSLLLLPAQFTFYDLFYQIANLSYEGDFRMVFGETKDKVKNIVKPQLNDFFQLYLPILEQQELSNHIKFSSGTNVSIENFENINISQKKCHNTNLIHLQQLPSTITLQLIKLSKTSATNKEIALNNIARDTKLLAYILRKSINEIVWNSSVIQSLKNIPTAGIMKSFQYSWKKALKTFNL